ncbi:MarR family winged helix-turn-helix transcriptional regulator [Halodurantibacterium flavum]|uniref:MarR family winged helix-turn-helix transcriptional regulator n=1 Tax=Halodurantibacterium flavum TaxID=1382802 RepID=A0ABW4SA73_9RHOB
MTDVSPSTAGDEESGEQIRELMLFVGRLSGNLDKLLRKQDPALTMSQWLLLETLAAEGPSRPFAVARKMGITRQAIAQSVRKLAAAELISIDESDEASRAMIISSTDTGLAAVQAIEEQLISLVLAKNPKKRSAAAAKALPQLKLLAPAFEARRQNASTPSDRDLES